MTTIRAVAVGCVLLRLLPSEATAAPAPPAPAEAMYADAVAKETAVRTALANPHAPSTVLKAVHTVVNDFESIVRFYPTSGYSDDALWRAGLVSLDAFNKFGDPHDRDAGLRLLRLLASQYPTSKLAKHVPAVLATVGTAAEPPAPAPTPHARPVPGAPVTPPPSTVKLSTIKDIRRTVLPDGVRITIEADSEVPFHEERLDGPSRIFVDFQATRAAAAVADRTLRFDGDADPVHQIRVGRPAENVTRIVLDATGVSSYSVYPLYDPYRLVVDCLRTPQSPVRTMALAARPPAAAKPPAVPTLKGRPLVRDLVFSLASAAPLGTDALARVFDAPETPVAGDVNATTLSIAPAPSLPAIGTLPAPDRNLAGGFSIARQLGLGVSRIVIDPGHGGHDPGASGKGITEAELVLDVALRLEKLLQSVSGTEVILTRRADEYVSLQERTAIANREGADLFLSIHANASSNEQARGVETYYLDFASNLDSAAVAARENAASGQAMGALPDFVKSIALNNKLDESRDFATDVQRTMIEKLRGTNKAVKDLGVKQAPFMVLIGAAMPSVLAEISFVTNTSEARLLNGAAYRQRIAEALFSAVRKYQTSLKSVAAATQ